MTNEERQILKNIIERSDWPELIKDLIRKKVNEYIIGTFIITLIFFSTIRTIKFK